MAKDPRFNFYPDNWEGGTEGFTLQQEGAYLALIILQSRRGPFTATQALDKLMTKTRGDAAASAELWRFLMPKFETDGRLYWSARLAREIEKSARNSKKQSERASKRWGHAAADAGDHAQTMPAGTGIGTGTWKSKEEEVQEEEGARQILTRQLDSALDELTLEPLRMKARTLYPGVNFDQALERYRTKVLADPAGYADHDVSGLRRAFIFHLKSETVKPFNHGKPNTSNRTQDNADQLARDYIERHNAGAVT